MYLFLFNSLCDYFLAEFIDMLRSYF